MLIGTPSKSIEFTPKKTFLLVALVQNTQLFLFPNSCLASGWSRPWAGRAWHWGGGFREGRGQFGRRKGWIHSKQSILKEYMTSPKIFFRQMNDLWTLLNRGPNPIQLTSADAAAEVREQMFSYCEGTLMLLTTAACSTDPSGMAEVALENWIGLGL